MGHNLSGVHSEPSSFRDPSGFIYKRNGCIYRQVNQKYQVHYDHLMNSGLYEKLIEESYLIPHEESPISEAAEPTLAYKILKPSVIPYVSYPYEWSFEQLKDAALLTLQIQKMAMEYGMSLKDSSAFNVQFYNGAPVFIDTLSFELIEDGKPWVAYRQFCQHFYAPLVLMSKLDIRLNQLFRIYIDGAPLDMASKMLSFSTYFDLSILSNIHLHSKSQKRYSDKQGKGRKPIQMSTQRLLAFINYLESGIKKLVWKHENTEWGDYYNNTNYSDVAMSHKLRIVTDYLNKIKPRHVWDMGANTGYFSRIASKMGIQTISFDIDPSAVNQNYIRAKKEKERCILPLIQDLTNPSSSIGWAHAERCSLIDRGPVDMAFALAIVHHLAISNNVPFRKIAEFFASICNNLVIEFVPINDSQVQRLITTRENIFSDYTQDGFEEQFRYYFDIVDSIKVNESNRIVYLMSRRDSLS